MRLSVGKAIGFTDGPHKSSVSLQDLVEQFAVVNMEPFLSMAIGTGWSTPFYQLRLINHLEIHTLVQATSLTRLHILVDWGLVNVEITVFVEEILCSP